MAEWIKAGVTGDLNHQAQKCKGRMIALYRKQGHDFYLTSVREGTHKGGSFHPIGDAFDFLYGVGITQSKIRDTAGPGFDLVFHKSHIHCEWDPKNG